MKTKLLAHQKKAFDKLKGLKVGGLLMDMGTGKTRTMLEIISHKKEKIDYVFWLTPCDTKKNLSKEIEKHSTYSYEIVGNTIVSNSFIKIIGIESISMSDKLYLSITSLFNNRLLSIIDESSFIKNPRASRTYRSMEISNASKYRYIMNGTAITLGYQDLYSQLKFLSPLILGYNSFYSYARNHLEWDEKYKRYTKAHNTEYIAKKMNPYVYQVTKEECLNLPDQAEYDYTFKLNEDQKIFYEEAKEEFFESMYEEEYRIYELFTKLQRVTSGLVSEHSRIKTLRDALNKVSGKTIVFTRFVGEVDEIISELTEYTVFNYYGSRKKISSIEEFENSKDENALLVMTISSGAFGLNLQFANNCIFYSYNFNYGLYKQARDRIYRVGQTRQTTIINIYAEKTIDQFIDNNIIKKKRKMSELVDELESIKDNKEAVIAWLKKL